MPRDLPPGPCPRHAPGDPACAHTAAARLRAALATAASRRPAPRDTDQLPPPLAELGPCPGCDSPMELCWRLPGLASCCPACEHPAAVTA